MRKSHFHETGKNVTNHRGQSQNMQFGFELPCPTSGIWTKSKKNRRCANDGLRVVPGRKWNLMVGVHQVDFGKDSADMQIGGKIVQV